MVASVLIKDNKQGLLVYQAEKTQTQPSFCVNVIVPKRS